MKKFWLKLAIWVLDKVEDKIMVDLDKDDVNDFTEMKNKLQDKLDNLNK